MGWLGWVDSARQGSACLPPSPVLGVQWTRLAFVRDPILPLGLPALC